jgi:hypothetical protein
LQHQPRVRDPVPISSATGSIESAILRGAESSARWFKARIEDKVGQCEGSCVGEAAPSGFAHFRPLETVRSGLNPAQLEEQT